MMNTKRKLWTLLLSVCLAFSLLAGSAAFAEPQSGSILDDFSTTSVSTSLAAEVSNMTGGASATHGALPAPAWGGSVRPGTGYLVYRVDAGMGNLLSALTLDLNAKVTHFGYADHATNNLKVYVSEDGVTFGEPVQTIASTSENIAKDHNFELGDEAVGKRLLYLKIELNNVSSGSYFNEDGTLDLAHVGVKLYRVELNYTFDTDPSAGALAEFSLADDFTQNTLGGTHASSWSGVYGSAGSHGLIPSSAWGDPITAGTGWVTYELKPDGVFQTLNFEASVRLGVQTSGMTHAINLYVSEDGEEWGDPVFQRSVTDTAYVVTTIQADLTEYAAGKKTLFAKLELAHSPGQVSLSFCGLKVFNLSFNGGYLPDEEVPAEPFEQTIAITDADNHLDGLSNLYENNNLKTYTSSGQALAMAATELTASGVVRLEAPELREFYDLTLAFFGRCTVYNGKTFEKAITISVSRDNLAYTEVRSFDTDENWSRTNFSADLSEAVRGWSTVYVRVAIAFPDDWTDSTDWVAFGSLAFSGGTVERTVFDIAYYNMEGAVYAEGEENPAVYEAGTELTLRTPSREHYTFAGWFDNADLEGDPLTVIPAGQKGNLSLYAKWVAEEYDLILDAGEGAFEGGSKTETVKVSYGTTLSRSDLPADPVLEGVGFIGWYCDAEYAVRWIFEEDLGMPTVVDGSVLTLYARYANAVKVTFDYNDGVTASIEQTCSAGETAVQPDDPERAGYLFGGWKLNGEDFDFETLLVEDLVLSADWAKIYTITYLGVEQASHDNPTSFTRLSEDIVLTPAERTGYIFDGWFEDEAEVSILDTGREEDITLEARWTAKTYALTLRVGEHGSITPADLQEISFTGQKFTVSAEEGWRIASVTVNGETVSVGEDGSFTVAGIDAEVTIAVSFAARVTLGISTEQIYPGNPEWKNAVYDVHNLKSVTDNGKYIGWAGVENIDEPGYMVYRFAAPDGGTFRSMSFSTVARVFSYEGSEASFKIFVSVDGGAWTAAGEVVSTTDGDRVENLSLNLNDLVRGASVVMLKVELVSGFGDWVCFERTEVQSALTAVTVTFRDGDQIIGANTDQQKGGVFVPMDPQPVKDGWEFWGWYQDAELTRPVEADFKVTEAMTVYARWNAVNYDIIYELNGGQNGDNPESYTVEDSFDLAPAELAGSKFLGWYRTADFSGEPITRIEAGSYGQITLYARFLAGSPITYELNGGVNAADNPEMMFDEDVTLADPTREGWTFAGWYLEADFQTLVTELAPGEALTVYARWIENSSGTSSGGCNGCGGSFSGTGMLAILSAAGMVLFVRKKK